MDKQLSYYIHVEEMRPLSGNTFAAKPILSRRFRRHADDEPLPIGEQWAPSQSEAVSQVRAAMQEWAERNGYVLSEG